jgi:hypothetical protein
MGIEERAVRVRERVGVPRPDRDATIEGAVSGLRQGRGARPTGPWRIIPRRSA